MKQLLVLTVLIALTGLTAAASVGGASRKIDWSLVRPISEFPHVARRIQNLLGDVAAVKTNRNQRIVGGTIASPGQIPYQVYQQI